MKTTHVHRQLTLGLPSPNECWAQGPALFTWHLSRLTTVQLHMSEWHPHGTFPQASPEAMSQAGPGLGVGSAPPQCTFHRPCLFFCFHVPCKACHPWGLQYMTKYVSPRFRRGIHWAFKYLNVTNSPIKTRQRLKIFSLHRPVPFHNALIVSREKRTHSSA